MIDQLSPMRIGGITTRKSVGSCHSMHGGFLDAGDLWLLWKTTMQQVSEDAISLMKSGPSAAIMEAMDEGCGRLAWAESWEEAKSPATTGSCLTNRR